MVPRANNRTGVVLVYAAITFTVLVAVAALAVDWARVQLVKTELQRSADAAALAAAHAMSRGDSTSTVQSDGVLLASYNGVDLNGDLATVTASDVQVGNWSGGAFTAGTSGNAVRVTARHTVHMVLAKAIGIASINTTASAVAAFTPYGFGVIGLDFIKMSGNSSMGYWSSTGTTVQKYGSIASNGPITLSGSTYVYGDARPGVGQSVTGATKVAGSTAPLTTPLSYPNGSSAPYTTSYNDNGNLPDTIMSSGSINMNNKVASVPGGHYLINNFDLKGNASISFTGPTTLYCYGTVSLKGNVVTSDSQSRNLKIVMIPNPYDGSPPGSIDIGSSAALYASIYAPQSAITLSGTGDIYGSVVGKSVDMTGTSSIRYDLDYSSNGGVVLVR